MLFTFIDSREPLRGGFAEELEVSPSDPFLMMARQIDALLSVADVAKKAGKTDRQTSSPLLSSPRVYE